jgi:hypothetical protein
LALRGGAVRYAKRQERNLKKHVETVIIER